MLLLLNDCSIQITQQYNEAEKKIGLSQIDAKEFNRKIEEASHINKTVRYMVLIKDS